MERKASGRDKLRDIERLLMPVLQALPFGVWIMDRTGRIVHGNPAGLEIWKGAHYVGPDDFAVYKGWWADSGRLIAADEWAGARAIRKGETSIGEEIEIECFDGSHRIILNSAIPLFDDDDHTIQGAIIVNQDITARKKAEEELRVLSRIDALTGITNRRHFFDLAMHEIAVAARYRQPLALILFDIDEFKRTNDTRGHRAGDELLKSVAATVQEHLRASDIFARYGGDEFVVLLPHTHGADASVVAERMRSGVAAQGIVTISCGISELLRNDDTADTLIHRADMALYDAKQAGRNRISLFAVTP